MFSFRSLSIFMTVVSFPSKSYVWVSSAMISGNFFVPFTWLSFPIFLMPCNCCCCCGWCVLKTEYLNIIMWLLWKSDTLSLILVFLFFLFCFILIVKGYSNALLSEFSKLFWQRLYSLSHMVIEISVPLVHVQLII